MAVRRRLVPALAGVVAVAGLLVACDGGSDTDQKSDGPYCRLVSRSIVEMIAGDASVESDGAPGSTGAEWDPIDCTVRLTENSRSIVDVSVSRVTDAAAMTQQLAAEAKQDPACTTRYDGEPGQGYGCAYGDGGKISNGAQVDVLRDDRLIRVRILRWPDTSPQQQLDLARTIVLDVDENLTAVLS